MTKVVEKDGPNGYAVLAADATPAAVFDGVAIPGRDRQRGIIRDELRGDRTGTIVIVGPPGVGKTHFAHAAVDAARKAGRPVRLATATRATASIPLGAMVHLVPPSVTSDRFTLLQRALAALTTDQHGRPPVVVIDDAHLLDMLSVGLVMQLASSGRVAVVLTMSTDATAKHSATGALSALWKDGTAVRTELRPLTRDDADLLVAGGLGGDLDTRTAERLWRLSRGNPLFLRELVDGGRESGHLRRRNGPWRWNGEMRPSTRLVEIALAQVGELDPRQRSALEVLAIGEPLDLERLAQLDLRDAVVELERRGVVTVDRAGTATVARIAHPLHAEVVRGVVPGAVADRIRRQLPGDLTPRPTTDELQRSSRVLLDADEPDQGVDLLTTAACQANGVLDHALAERFAHAAVRGGAGIRAHLALLEAVQWQGRAVDAEALAAAAVPLAVTDRDRSTLAAMRALNTFAGLGRTDRAESILDAAAATTSDAESLDALAATSALIAFLSGRAGRAVDIGTAVLRRAGTGTFARPLALGVVAAGLAVTGRAAESLSASAEGWSDLRRIPGDRALPCVRMTLATGELLALWLAGRLPELEGRAAELHRDGMAGPEWAGDAISALHMGWAALGTGRLGSATRWLVEAETGMRRGDPAGLRSLCTAQLAQTRAQLGDTTAARELLGDAEPDPVLRVFEPLILLAHAWQAAVESRHAASADLVRRAAAVAAQREQPAVEAMALHCAVQLGMAPQAAGRLRDLADRFDGSPMFDACSAHADAAAADAGPALDRVSGLFEGLGAMLPAADAAAQAAEAYQRAGDRRCASISTATAVRLAAACGGARTPALARVAQPRLTPREHQVAHLAAQGLTSQFIAEQLVLSVRTIEAHLQNAYAKLGITSRTQLGEAIGLTTAARTDSRPAGTR